jgi:transposase
LTTQDFIMYSLSHILSTNGSRVLFLRPYNPQFNPIEQLFSQIKTQYKNYRPRPTSQEDLQKVIETVMASLQGYSMEGYFWNMREWFVKAQQRLPFI